MPPEPVEEKFMRWDRRAAQRSMLRYMTVFFTLSPRQDACAHRSCAASNVGNIRGERTLGELP
jgi:hypothetical protein